MTKIRENLYLGSWNSAKPEELKKNGITAVLDVAFDTQIAYFEYHHEPLVYHPDEFRRVSINLGDYQDNKPYMKDLAIQTLKAMLYNGEKVLVHCVAGASRSVYVVVRLLSELEGRSYHDVFEEIQKLRPIGLLGPMEGPLFANK